MRWNQSSDLEPVPAPFACITPNCHSREFACIRSEIVICVFLFLRISWGGIIMCIYEAVTQQVVPHLQDEAEAGSTIQLGTCSNREQTQGQGCH